MWNKPMHALIVDDHDLFRKGLSQALLEQSDVISIAEANSLQSARTIIQAQHHTLNLVILDHSLPDGTGIALLKEIQECYPLLPVAILSAHEDVKLMRTSLDAGAVGFIPKSTSTSLLLSAIKLLLIGGIYMPPGLHHKKQQSEPAKNRYSLTKRQNEVLQFLFRGYSNKQIAWQLNIAETTVKAHVTMILKYHGVSSRSRLLTMDSINSTY